VVFTAHDARPLPGTTPGLLTGGYRRLAASADAVVVHSEAARTDLLAMGLGAQRLHVIPLAIALDTGALPDRALARQSLGIQPEGSVVLFFGFVKRYKGLAVLLASLPRLRAARPDVTLIVAGEFVGSHAAYARLAERLGVNDAIRWRPGFVASSDVAALFAAADVVALPYVAASSSAVLLTAYASRRPVVASAIGGLVELVDQCVTGILVPPDDPSALAEALASVLSHRGRAEEMGNRGHARLATHHDWDTVARLLDDLYRMLAA
jgi:D-inositol-3-phosphate glycosyltransferase